MSDFAVPNNQREFRCSHCDGKILIPKNLPPTTGPCPHCSGEITSPAIDNTAPDPVVESVPISPAPLPAAPAPSVSSPPAAVERPKPPPVPGSFHPPSPPVSETSPPAKEESPVSTQIELPPPVSSKGKKSGSSSNAKKSKRSSLIPAVLIFFVIVLALATGAYFVGQEMNRAGDAPAKKPASGDSSIAEANYIRVGWQKEAYTILRDYIAGSTAREKLPYILNPKTLASHVDDFYLGGVINDSDTPAEAFSVYELAEADRKRGLFMLIYDQPPQFDMKEFFRPLASLEVQYGMDEAGLLLSTMARLENFAMEPLRVHAFFKRTPDGLKLDWEIFAQTKYRTFQSFTELPEVGQTGVFRVFMVEDVPDKGRAVAGTRTYRLADPANTGDSARLNVKIDSEIGRTLSIINWRGSKDNRPITRTATVELKWTGDATLPELEISRFICWEFLGLGGQETPATASTK